MHDDDGFVDDDLNNAYSHVMGIIIQAIQSKKDAVILKYQDIDAAAVDSFVRRVCAKLVEESGMKLHVHFLAKRTIQFSWV